MIDPKTRELSQVGAQARFEYKWSDIASGPDLEGRLYCAPFDATQPLIYLPAKWAMKRLLCIGILKPDSTASCHLSLLPEDALVVMFCCFPKSLNIVLLIGVGASAARHAATNF